MPLIFRRMDRFAPAMNCASGDFSSRQLGCDAYGYAMS